MIEIKRFEGKNLDDAIKKACEYFKREKDELEIKVIEPGSSGFLGLRSKNSVIEVTPKIISEEDLRIFTESVIKKILSYISPEAKVEVTKENGKILVRLDVGGDIGLVIGKERQNLNALELLVNLIVGKKIMEKVDIKIEVKGIRQQPKRSFKSLESRRQNSGESRKNSSQNSGKRQRASRFKRDTLKE